MVNMWFKRETLYGDDEYQDTDIADVIIVNHKCNCVWRNDGDISEIILDLDTGSLEFVVNGTDCGVAFSNIPQKSYRLALTCDGAQGSEFAFYQ